ncbi:MAG: molybdopterin-dependent oxidoreductase, partial [Desulfofustis sp.]|nr:molybdopterin-dependent oxidoreductase [Desulfofustis sp.]
PLDCPDSCAMLATVENDRLVSLAGDPQHPYTRGVICRKMRRFPERLSAEQRLLFPQVRVGGKGEGRFARIGWDEAWQRLVDGLQRIVAAHGGEAIMPFSYAGNMGLVNRFAGYPFFHRLGATRIRQTICSAAASGAWKLGCGSVGGSPPQIAAESSLIVAWGINIRVTNIHFWSYVNQARKAGAKLLVIDPYRNDTARCADEHLPVKPGGDSGLALGLLRILSEQGRLDQRFIAEQTSGFQRLDDYLQTVPMEHFEEQSGVSRCDMERLASQLADQPRTFFRVGVGLTRNSRGGMAVRAITALAAALGLYDGQPGRGVLLFSGAFGGDPATLQCPELLRGKPRTINMIHLGRALTAADPPVHGLIVYNSNPVSVAPDGTTVRRGLAREDLFTVVHEQVMTPTARYADLLLPATTFLENRDVYRAYGHFFLGIADRVVAPAGETISNFDFFQTLARRMGYDDPPFQQSLDERIRAYLATVDELPAGALSGDFLNGCTVESLLSRQRGSAFARTGTRYRFVNDDDPLLPPHACLLAGREFDHPDLISRFPLQLITPPVDRLLNSTFGERYPQESGTVLIHPLDAQQRGIVDGATVAVHNFRGRVERRAVLTEATQPGLVVAEGIYWPVTERGGAINDLVSQQCSDVGGGALFHESRVEVDVTG